MECSKKIYNCNKSTHFRDINPLKCVLLLVETTGLEPAASCSQSRHSTKLSYVSKSFYLQTNFIISYLFAKVKCQFSSALSPLDAPRLNSADFPNFRLKHRVICDIIQRNKPVFEGEDVAMVIRKYQHTDCKEVTELFYTTVHTINAKDYTKEQLDAWAGGQLDLENWNQSLQKHYSVVAVENKTIVGFGDIDETGCLNRLFVHANYQGKGIATAICNRLEKFIQGNIITYASITARPFFEKRGYKTIKKQQVERQGILLINYVMIKN